jgi:Zn-finger nucleic acid-binding protein
MLPGMRCPVCRQEQVIVEHRGVELDLCLQGCGIWFDADELRQLFDVIGAPERLQDLEQRLVVLRRGLLRARRRCPRCRGIMDQVLEPGTDNDVILDRCRRGHGLWFDEGELEEILELQLEEGDEALAQVRQFLGGFTARATASGPVHEEEG